MAQSGWFLAERSDGALMSLLAEERRFRIREILSRERTVTASELIRTLEVTAATIRRDLAALEKEGAVSYTHLDVYKRQAGSDREA